MSTLRRYLHLQSFLVFVNHDTRFLFISETLQGSYNRHEAAMHNIGTELHVGPLPRTRPLSDQNILKIYDRTKTSLLSVQCENSFETRICAAEMAVRYAALCACRKVHT